MAAGYGVDGSCTCILSFDAVTDPYMAKMRWTIRNIAQVILGLGTVLLGAVVGVVSGLIAGFSAFLFMVGFVGSILSAFTRAFDNIAPTVIFVAVGLSGAFVGGALWCLTTSALLARDSVSDQFPIRARWAAPGGGIAAVLLAASYLVAERYIVLATGPWALVQGGVWVALAGSPHLLMLSCGLSRLEANLAAPWFVAARTLLVVTVLGMSGGLLAALASHV